MKATDPKSAEPIAVAPKPPELKTTELKTTELKTTEATETRAAGPATNPPDAAVSAKKGVGAKKAAAIKKAGSMGSAAGEPAGSAVRGSVAQEPLAQEPLAQEPLAQEPLAQKSVAQAAASATPSPAQTQTVEAPTAKPARTVPATPPSAEIVPAGTKPAKTVPARTKPVTAPAPEIPPAADLDRPAAAPNTPAGVTGAPAGPIDTPLLTHAGRTRQITGADLWAGLKTQPRRAPAVFALAVVYQHGRDAEQQASWLARRYPGVGPERQAHVAQHQATRRARRAAVAGVPFGGLVGAPMLGWTQARLVLEVAAIFGRDAHDPDRAVEMLSLLGFYGDEEAAIAVESVLDAAKGPGFAAPPSARRPHRLSQGRRAIGHLAMGRFLTGRLLAGRLWPGAALVIDGIAAVNSIDELASKAIRFYRRRPVSVSLEERQVLGE